MLLHCLFILLGFVLLIKGADFLVSGASSLAKSLSIPDLIIGLTVVAMGTSAPELVVNLFSATRGDEKIEGMDMVFGNIIGSNMFNTFVILGIASLIYPLEVRLSVLKKDLPYSFAALLALFLLVNDTLIFGFRWEGGALGMFDSIVLIAIFVAFLSHTFLHARAGRDSESEDIDSFPLWKSILYVVLGGGGLGLWRTLGR